MAKLIEVEGEVVEFPDDMTDAQIEAVLSGQRTEWGAGRQLLQGLTFGFADEAEAWMRSLKGDSTYEQEHARLGVARKGYEAQNPGAALGLEVAGALPTVVVPGLGAARAGQLAAKLGTTAARYLGAAGSGAASGALSGAGHAEPGGRIAGAAGEAAVGAVAGPAMGAAGQTVKGAAQMVRDVTSGLPILGPTGKVISRVGGAETDFAKRAEQKLLQALQRDGLTPEQAVQRLEALRAQGIKPETLQEVGGENVRKLADTAAQYPGKAASASAELAATRSAEQGARIGQDLSAAFKVDGDPYRIASSLRDKRRVDAQPLYEQAHREVGQINDARISELMRMPQFASAYIKARRIAALDGIELPVKPSEVSAWDLQTLDYIKRGLDDVIYLGKTPQRGMGKTELEKLKERRAEFVGILDYYSPTYAQARAAYAGPSRLMEALEEGQEFYKMDPRELNRTLAELTDSEREQFTIGALDSIRSRMRSASDGRDLTKEVFGSQQKREQIRALVGEEQFDLLERQFARERAIRAVDQRRVGGSPTARRLLGAGDLEADDTVVRSVVEQGPLRGAMSYLLRSGSGVAQPTAEALSDTLYTPEFAQQMQALRRLQLLDEELRRRALGQGVMTGTAAGQAGGLLD